MMARASLQTSLTERLFTMISGVGVGSRVEG